MSIKEISKELIKAFTSNNKRLSRLDFSKNQIKVIQNLNELKHLQVLNLSENEIEFIDGLSELILLQQINLSNNQISTISNMRNLKNLEVLDLSFNNLGDIRDLSELKYNKNLKELNVQGNVKITCNYDYRDRIKQLIPQILKIDGLNMNQQQLLNIPQEVIEQKSIEAYKNIINVLENQVQSHNPDALEQWRKKCFELLQREKIMNFRFNQQEQAFSKDLNSSQAKIKELIEQNANIEDELQKKREEIVVLKENIEQSKVMFQNQLKKDTSIIYAQFENQMNQLQEVFNSQIKQQQKRLFTLEGTLLKQKTKMMDQRKSFSTDFIEFKQSLKSIIKAHANKEIQADINTDDFLNEIERIIRDSLIQLNQTQFKSNSNTSRFEIKQLEEEINSLNQQKKNLSTLLQEQEEQQQKIKRNNELKLREIEEDLEFKTRKVKEQNQSIYDLQQKLDKEIQEKQGVKSKLIDLEESHHLEIKKKVDEATSKMKFRIDELERENGKLANALKEKDQETAQIIENVGKKVLIVEQEKNNAISILENELKIESEKKNMFSNQCNDMMRIINMKENKIRAIKDEQRQLQDKLNQTMNQELYYNQNNNVNNYNSRGNVSHNDIYNNYQQMTYQNQRILQNQIKPIHNNLNNLYDTKNFQMNSNPILNQTDIQYNYKPKQQQQQQSQEDWSPIGNKTNLSYNFPRQTFKQTAKNQEINNFGTNKANMILNDLSIIQNDHPCADTLEDELKKLEQNENFAQDILNDGL